jgi:hypothetical protein
MAHRYETFVTIAAEDTARLRISDVYRVLSEVPRRDVADFAAWLVRHRPDLGDEVATCCTEIVES